MDRNEEKSQNPDLAQVINDFFEVQNLESCKAQLWECMFATISSNETDDWTAQQRGNLLYLYEQLLRLLEKLNKVHTTLKM